MTNKKLSTKDIIKEIIEFNYNFNRLKFEIDYPVNEPEEMDKVLWTIFKDERITHILNEYENQKEELQILDPKEYENWVYENKPYLFGCGALHPSLIVIFEKDASFSNKLALFKKLIEDIPIRNGYDRLQLKYKINAVKERNFVESFNKYKDVLLQLESRHCNDINAIPICGIIDENRVKECIVSILKNYSLNHFEMNMIVDYIYFNYDYGLFKLMDTISSLNKDDIVLDLRLNLTDTTEKERRILFLRFFEVHIMSLYNIKNLKEKTNVLEN